MKKLILFLCAFSYFFIFCNPQNATFVKNNLNIDTTDLSQNWIKQISIMYDTISKCCFCIKKPAEVPDIIKKQLSIEFNEINFKSFQNFDISTVNFSFNEYPHCRNIYPMHILQYNNKSYYWVNIDFVDNFFWRWVKYANDDSNKYFKYNVFRYNQKIYYQNNCEWDIDDSLQSCYFNWHRYVSSKNEKGYIFSATHFAQFDELNTFLKNNSYYHTNNSLLKIDSLLFILHNRINNTDNVSMWLKLSKKTLFKNINKEIDTILLKKNGVDFNNVSIHYFDGVITNKCLNKFNELVDCYVGFKQKIDTLAILKDYLTNNNPTFLYYKNTGNIYSTWHNYFVAYYIDYQNNIPKITKVDIITPKIFYNYICYPAPNCNAFAGDHLFSILEY